MQNVNFSGAFMGAIQLLLSSCFVLFLWVFALFLAALISFVACFFIRYRVTPLSSVERLAALEIRFKWYDLFRWLIVDFKERKKNVNVFGEYGFSIFVGKQGAGKTMSMVYYLYAMKCRYPDCIIVTNFQCDFADRVMRSWRDILTIRNGDKGVIFAIDEIHSEYDSASWRDFPESLLSEISQQRKQRIKIVATSQVYARVAKPIREQCFSVIECKTLFHRLTCCREYESFLYDLIDTPFISSHSKIKPWRKYSFVQNNKLRSSYDTFQKIERLAGRDFLARADKARNGGTNVNVTIR